LPGTSRLLHRPSQLLAPECTSHRVLDKRAPLSLACDDINLGHEVRGQTQVRCHAYGHAQMIAHTSAPVKQRPKKRPS
jgi:hypothetical protein